MSTGNLIKKISPFNDRQDMPAALFAIKKMLAFFLVYGLSAVVGEILIIGILYAMGCDPLRGVMPAGRWAELLPLYGFAVFTAAALMYCKLIEKRSAESTGFTGKLYDYPVGGAAGVLMLGTVVGACCITGALSFEGITSTADVIYLLALFAGFAIQSMAEETLCRGFLLSSLSRKVSLPSAVFVSSTAFALPHLPSILEEDARFAVIALINLYLISAVFSLLYVLRRNIYIVSGLHCLWNFVLGGIIGLSVSGGGGSDDALMVFRTNGRNLLNGGTYGLESSVITTAVSVIAVIILTGLCRKGGTDNGVQ